MQRAHRASIERMIREAYGYIVPEGRARADKRRGNAEGKYMPAPLMSPVRTITATLSYEEVAALVLLWKRKSAAEWRTETERISFEQDRDSMATLVKGGADKLFVELEAALARAV